LALGSWLLALSFWLLANRKYIKEAFRFCPSTDGRAGALSFFSFSSSSSPFATFNLLKYSYYSKGGIKGGFKTQNMKELNFFIPYFRRQAGLFDVLD
jgi:hypothetical protein